MDLKLLDNVTINKLLIYQCYDDWIALFSIFCDQDWILRYRYHITEIRAGIGLLNVGVKCLTI